MTTQLRYKFLVAGIRSRFDHSPWVIGEWRNVGPGPIELCHRGFHCSDHPITAMRYVPDGTILAVVETAGGHKSDRYKSAWRRMRIVRAYTWTAMDARALNTFLYRLLKRPRYDGVRYRESINRDTAAGFDMFSPAEKKLYAKRLERWVLRRARSRRIVPKRKK